MVIININVIEFYILKKIFLWLKLNFMSGLIFKVYVCNVNLLFVLNIYLFFDVYWDVINKLFGSFRMF